MRLVAETIRQNLKDQDIYFVFPSEIVAAFWRRRALTLTRHNAVRSDRFMSWDIFKEKAFARRQNAVPANSFTRLCFAVDLLIRNTDDGGVLKALVLPDFAESWRPFAKTIARMLPSIKLLLEDERVTALLNPKLRSDFESVNREYARFLESHNLFEPLHEPTLAVETQPGIVFFSSVIADFAEYEPFLDPRMVTIEPAREPAPLPKAWTYVPYANAKIEVKQTCLAIRRLLDHGETPSRIAITLTKWSGYYEELRDTALLYDIPLLPRAGQSLADYPEVRIYRLLQECIASGFAVSALKELFLNIAVPWVNPEAGRNLVRFGIDSFGIQNFTVGNKKNDEWERCLRVAYRKELLEFYLQFKQAAESVTNADTFVRLRGSVMAFNGRFLDTTAFSDSQSRAFSTALDLLSTFEEAAAHLQDLRIDSPFSLWMMSLTDRRYVQPVRGDGVPVYEYRVAAGIQPEYHFVLGVSQESSAVTIAKYPFLAMNQVPDEIRNGGDFTESFFRLYERSGSNVILSSGTEGFDGPATPVERFVNRSTAGEIEAPLKAEDYYSREVDYWNGDEVSLGSLYTQQREGLSYIGKTAFQEKGNDLTLEALTRPDLSQLSYARQTSEDGVLRISPTNLDIWMGCRFGYLLKRVLGLEEIEFDTVYSSPLESGILYHALFAKVLSAVDAVSDPEERTATAGKVVESVFASWTRANFLPPVLNDLRRRAEEKVLDFVRVDAESFPGSKVEALEQTLEVGVDRTSTALYGRIDRISAVDGGFIVVDYKSRLWKKRSGMVAEDGSLLSFQVPIYLRLVEETLGPVKEALYYDIYESRYSSVFGGKKPWFDDEQREDLLNQTNDAVSTMISGIEAGEYTTPGPGDSCNGCEFRAVCRKRYRVR